MTNSAFTDALVFQQLQEDLVLVFEIQSDA